MEKVFNFKVEYHDEVGFLMLNVTDVELTKDIKSNFEVSFIVDKKGVIYGKGEFQTDVEVPVDKRERISTIMDILVKDCVKLVSQSKFSESFMLKEKIEKMFKNHKINFGDLNFTFEKKKIVYVTHDENTIGFIIDDLNKEDRFIVSYEKENVELLEKIADFVYKKEEKEKTKILEKMLRGDSDDKKDSASE